MSENTISRRQLIATLGLCAGAILLPSRSANAARTRSGTDATFVTKDGTRIGVKGSRLFSVTVGRSVRMRGRTRCVFSRRAATAASHMIERLRPLRTAVERQRHEHTCR